MIPLYANSCPNSSRSAIRSAIRVLQDLVVIRTNVMLALGELFCLSGREAPLVRREAPVFLPAAGGFLFGRWPNVLFAVDELFVRARRALNQARSACVIARRRRVLLRPKAERFYRLSQVFSSTYLAASMDI